MIVRTVVYNFYVGFVFDVTTGNYKGVYERLGTQDFGAELIDWETVFESDPDSDDD